MVDIDTANYKAEIKRLERELAQRNEQLIVATKLADSRYNELQELHNNVTELTANKYPMQPMINKRFEANPIVNHFVPDFNLVSVWCQQNDIDNKYQEQLAQLVGYSLGGYGDLSYVSDDNYYRAEASNKDQS